MKHLLSRPAATLSSIRNGGEGRGEEEFWFVTGNCNLVCPRDEF